MDRALALASELIPNLEPDGPFTPPDFLTGERANAELWLRMVFSALVDADFLDTERHFNPDQASAREPKRDVEKLWHRFQQRHQDLARQASGPISELRSEIYRACLATAEHRLGLFRLTVPTGGGKTLSSLGFALRHASLHGLERVVVAVPFTAITQQTAAVYREFLEDRFDLESATVLEHHSMMESSDGEEYDAREVWSRLASENWDAPVVVTTAVQLFHSLFSNRTSATRKLHRLANSVIVLDEAQSLPPRLLEPILDVLRQLTENYGASVVLSTATQPAFESIESFRDMKATEMVPDYPRHFQALRRVRYEWMINPALSWHEAADIMGESPQALAVVNTKKDALALLEALDEPDALHLSTLLCGCHRQEVIQEVRGRLGRGETCRVVSTQVVEAGVDLDFPLVLRAIGPLDSIIQAAGRCNRSGRLDSGRVVIFQPESGASSPFGSYRLATDMTKGMLNAGALDLDDPETVSEFFRRLYQFVDSDAEGIQGSRSRFDYPEVAARFRMIDDDAVVAVVTGYGTAAERSRIAGAIDGLRNGTAVNRSVMRGLQPWTVQIYRNQAASMIRSGLLAEVIPGLYEWRGDYDPITSIGGITTLEPDRLIV